MTRPPGRARRGRSSTAPRCGSGRRSRSAAAVSRPGRGPRGPPPPGRGPRCRSTRRPALHRPQAPAAGRHGGRRARPRCPRPGPSGAPGHAAAGRLWRRSRNGSAGVAAGRRSRPLPQQEAVAERVALVDHEGAVAGHVGRARDARLTTRPGRRGVVGPRRGPRRCSPVMPALAIVAGRSAAVPARAARRAARLVPEPHGERSTSASAKTVTLRMVRVARAAVGAEARVVVDDDRAVDEAQVGVGGVLRRVVAAQHVGDGGAGAASAPRSGSGTTRSPRSAASTMP